ncbi:inhibitor of growth protein 1-like [Oscarella lobularis]|uniref:inhibitor of growth protein 1-like n=1 Tax=Oscarella lobularis TaxID=121494 RepID=UPI0033141156
MSLQASQTYLERYLETVENLADDLQRLMSLMLELDAKTQAQLRQLRPQFQTYVKSFSDDGEGDADRRSLYKDVLQGILRCREFGDEKIQYSSQMQELVESHSRQLEEDLNALERARMEENMPPLTGEIQRNFVGENEKSKRLPRKRTNLYNMKEKDLIDDYSKDRDKPKKKIKKTNRGARNKSRPDDSPIHEAAVDPNEPTYCLCDQVSFGEMIGCDNENCSIEWFHFSCVGLSSKPKGKWYCPSCR